MSISFDRAAAYYDRTRALSQDSLAVLIPAVAEKLGGAKRVLEIGIGTGRIALPLLRQGVNITGIDISTEMLERLRMNADGRPPPLAVADAMHLPFERAVFGGAIAAHVLHLIPRWKSALDEVMRVVEPGGVLIASRGGRTIGAEWWVAVRRQFFRAAGDPPWPPGMDRIEELDEEMLARGAVLERLPEVKQESSISVNQLLAMLEQGIWSACWTIEPETRRHAVTSARAWAEANLGDLEERRTVTEVLAWRSYRMP